MIIYTSKRRIIGNNFSTINMAHGVIIVMLHSRDLLATIYAIELYQKFS